MEGYCVKCKQKRIMNDEKKITMKNGKPATQGICSTCGTKDVQNRKVINSEIYGSLKINVPHLIIFFRPTLMGQNS